MRIQNFGAPARIALLATSIFAVSLDQTVADAPRIGPLGSGQPYLPGPEPVAGIGSQAAPAPAATGSVLRIGDRIKVSFVEHLDLPAVAQGERNAATTQPALRTFLHRVDLGAESVIGDDGAIALPRLGRYRVEGRPAAAVEAELSEAFLTAVGRPGSATVTILERQPVYVLGGVGAPGAFKHAPGMIVLQAMALAGGATREAATNGQLLESAREVEQHANSVDRVARLLARKARIEADRDGLEAPRLPLRLVELVGETAARAEIETQSSLLGLEAGLKAGRLREVAAEIQQRQQEIAASRRKLEQIEAQIEARNERLGNLDRLAAKGLSARGQNLDTAAEIASLRMRRQELLIEIAAGERKAGEAERARAGIELEHRLARVRENVALGHEIVEAERALATLERVASAGGGLGVLIARTGGEAATGLEIVRRSADGHQVIPAGELTPLEPGDVLRVGMRRQPAGDRQVNRPLEPAQATPASATGLRAELSAPVR